MMRYTPTETEVLEILNKPDSSTVKGMRDKAIIELLYSSALRRSEVSGLAIDHIDIKDHIVRVINGKGGKDRLIPMTKKASRSIRHYLDKARPLLAKDPNNKALFLGEWGRRLSSGMINTIIHEYAVFNPKISAHSIRHATATHMLKRGANIIHLQMLLGHSSPKTTQIYTRLYPKDLIQAYKRFHPRERA